MYFKVKHLIWSDYNTLKCFKKRLWKRIFYFINIYIICSKFHFFKYYFKIWSTLQVHIQYY